MTGPEEAGVRYGRMPVIVGNDEIAAMLGVSKQRAKQLMDPRTHPRAPKGQQLRGGRFYLRSDVEAYALKILGREKTW
jgi:hypothetical protein